MSSPVSVGTMMRRSHISLCGVRRLFRPSLRALSSLSALSSLPRLQLSAFAVCPLSSCLSSPVSSWRLSSPLSSPLSPSLSFPLSSYHTRSLSSQSQEGEGRKRRKVVVALGGNALQKEHDTGSIEETIGNLQVGEWVGKGMCANICS